MIIHHEKGFYTIQTFALYFFDSFANINPSAHFVIQQVGRLLNTLGPLFAKKLRAKKILPVEKIDV